MNMDFSGVLGGPVSTDEAPKPEPTPPVTVAPVAAEVSPPAERVVSIAPAPKPENLTSSEFIATEIRGGFTGGLVQWRLRDVQIPVAELRARVAQYGFCVKDLPKEPSAAASLTWAVKSLAGTNQHVRQVKGSPWTQVTRIESTDYHNSKRNNYVFDYKARIDPNPITGKGQIVVEPAGHAITEQLREKYEWRRKHHVGEDFSNFLPGFVRQHLNGVGAPASKGGQYFIPAEELRLFEGYCDMLSTSGVRFFSIPATKDQGDLIELLTESITHEATMAIETIEAELVSNESKALGKNALETRFGTAMDLVGKVESYERLLGSQMPLLKETIARMGLKINDAKMAAIKG